MRSIALFILLWCLPSGLVYGQLTQSLSGTAPEVVISPLFPVPGSTFTASLSDYAVGNSGGGVTWRFDGVLQPSLTNQRTITVTAPDVGKRLVIEARSVTAEGVAVSGSSTIRPHYVDLIVEPQTRTPTFYKGRALPTTESQVNVTAIVNAGAIPPADLIYRWSVDGGVLFGGPVRGQSQVSFAMPIGIANLTLEVERAGEGTLGRRSVTLLPSEPTLRFYEVSPLYGLRTRPTQTLGIIGNSTTVRAEPYFLDLRTYNAPDIAVWEINNATANGGSANPYDITLVRNGSGGEALVDFHVRSRLNVVQGVRDSFLVRL